MSVEEIVKNMIEYWDFKNYTVDYLMICEQASIDEGIDYFKNENINSTKLSELIELNTFFNEHQNEIKEKLLKYQKDKYGDVGCGNVRVQGM